MAPYKSYGAGNKAFNVGAKGKQIEEFAEKKTKQIQKFTDDKSASIAVTSAFNGAYSLCVALTNNGLLPRDKFWETHEEEYNMYLERLAVEQVTGCERYNEIKQQVNQDARDDYYAKVKSEDVGVEGAEDIISE